MIKRQNTNHVMMVRPDYFGFNEETAESNTFQSKGENYDAHEVAEKAKKEFDEFVEKLRAEDITVHVAKDAADRKNTDAVFPNNWISFHQDDTIITYPMCSEKRRFERREDVIENIEKIFEVDYRYTFEHYEEKGQFLEGTGSMVLDRVNKIAYACLSPRTDVKLLDKFGVLKGYQIIHFKAQFDGTDIYHTNVMMAMGHGCVIICLDAVSNEVDRQKLLDSFERTDKQVIELTIDQMNAFAGNMLELETNAGEKRMVMSQQAFNSLRAEQISDIEKFAQIISSPIGTIEQYGGGSARCMIAEIFLSKKPE